MCCLSLVVPGVLPPGRHAGSSKHLWITNEQIAVECGEQQRSPERKVCSISWLFVLSLSITLHDYYWKSSKVTTDQKLMNYLHFYHQNYWNYYCCWSCKNRVRCQNYCLSLQSGGWAWQFCSYSHAEIYIFLSNKVPSHTPIRTFSWFTHIHKNNQKPETFLVRLYSSGWVRDCFSDASLDVMQSTAWERQLNHDK